MVVSEAQRVLKHLELLNVGPRVFLPMPLVIFLHYLTEASIVLARVVLQKITESEIRGDLHTAYLGKGRGLGAVLACFAAAAGRAATGGDTRKARCGRRMARHSRSRARTRRGTP